MKRQLTNQQKIFVSEYIRHLDAEKALTQAGYKVKNIKNFASELLCRDSIISEINDQLKHQIETLNVQKGYVVKKLLQIAEFSLAEEDILDKDGNSTGKRKLRDSSSGLKALESLCKYLGLSAKYDDGEYKEAKIITISNLDDEKI